MKYIEFTVYADNSAQLELIEAILMSEGIEDSVDKRPARHT